MKNKLKIAVIGCGRVSRTAHYNAINDNPDYEFVAVCDKDIKRAEKSAKANNVKCYNNVEELLEKEQLDVVSINVPNGLHHKIGTVAAKKRLHLICEKPLSIGVDEADDLIDICEANGVELFTILQNRYNKTSKLLKKAIDKGRFGRLHSANVTLRWRRSINYYMEDRKWRSRRDLAGGAFTNQGVHYIDMLQWLVGSPPETVYAKLGSGHPVDVETYGNAIIKFKNGVISSLEMSNLTYPEDLEGSITFMGEKGTVKIGGIAVNKIVYWKFSDSDPDDELINEAETSPPTVYGFGHIDFYKRVANYLLHGKNESLIIDGREGRKSVAILEAIYLSDKLGKEIHFPIGKR